MRFLKKICRCKAKHAMEKGGIAAALWLSLLLRLNPLGEVGQVQPPFLRF